MRMAKINPATKIIRSLGGWPAMKLSNNLLPFGWLWVEVQPWTASIEEWPFLKDLCEPYLASARAFAAKINQQQATWEQKRLEIAAQKQAEIQAQQQKQAEIERQQQTKAEHQRYLQTLTPNLKAVEDFKSSCQARLDALRGKQDKPNTDYHNRAKELYKQSRDPAWTETERQQAEQAVQEWLPKLIQGSQDQLKKLLKRQIIESSAPTLNQEITMPSLQKSPTSKKLSRILRSNGAHWVGNGFPVQTLFAYTDMGATLSPFLLLDYAGPAEFPPTKQHLGVGEHPHRGFETVTIVYSGEVEHRDSSGGSGSIGPGDVQWMTAASGVVHEEFHGRHFAQRGGLLEMIQLWVNLPAKLKMIPPRYQGILNSQIPVVHLPDHQGHIRVIAGEYAGVIGPAQTFTPIHIWDLRLSNQQPITLDVPEGYTTALIVLKGTLHLRDSTASIKAAEVGVFERPGKTIHIEMADNVTALLLCGEPINEPITGRGPFVMNTTEEITQAIADYQSGKMGHLT